MDIFGVLTLVGGLALFLYGMNVMGDGLVSLSGSRLQQILQRLTGRRITGLLLGTLVTAIIQSSSATTVMVVGFVNSGIMTLNQSVGVIMGANIGTTVTSWLLSLTGISGSNVFIKLLKPSSFSPILALIGIILVMFDKESGKKKNIGSILLGFAVLMTGMETMSSAVAPLKENEAFTGMLTAFSQPILGMIAGAVLTAIIQSSSASVGILQALCLTGAVTYGTAIPIIMGQNIGTCVTALISSIGANRNAKRASLIHLYFNLIGTTAFMVIFYSLNAFMHFSFLQQSASVMGVAVVHSLFNICASVVLFPFGGGLVKLAELTVRDRPDAAPTGKKLPPVLAALDERFLENPGFAIQLCKDAADEMAAISCAAFQRAMKNLKDYTQEETDAVVDMEQQTDMFEDVLGTYLVRLSGRDLAPEDSRLLSQLLHSLSDLERIADHAVNITESAQQMRSAGITMTDAGWEELYAFGRPVSDILDKTLTVFRTGDTDLARSVEPLEEVIDTLSEDMKQRHIIRLRKNICSLEAGVILEDIITNYERVSDHCSNLAVCLIELQSDDFDTHEYLNIRNSDPRFQNEYKRLQENYPLPQT